MLRKMFKAGMVLAMLGVFCVSIKAEEYFNDYSKEPQLTKYYGDWKTEKKEACDVHEIFPFKIDGRSYIQEFDVGFIKLGRYAHWHIGLYDGLIVFFDGGDNNQFHIFFHHPSGYLTYFKAEYEEGDIYHVKLIYDKEKSTAQCIVTDQKTKELILDTGAKLCEPIYPTDIHFATEYKEGPPYSFTEWDKENQRMHLQASTGEDTMNAIFAG